VNGVEAVLHSALRGLSLRQRTIADNIANIETPRFLAGVVDFESQLRDAVRDGEAPTAAPTTARSLQPTRIDGNNVNLDQETLSAQETGPALRAGDHRADQQVQRLRTAIGGA
jgi:flagellar basal-body rod protein FlgB